MAETSIEWTDATWNPVAGCTILSPGCTNCYAMRMAARLEAMSVPKYAGLTRKSGRRSVWTGKIRLDDKSLEIPHLWRKPRRIFVNSMSDLFHDLVPIDFVARVWNVMEKTPRHTYQILTKRPDRMAAIVAELPLLKNVWLGTSVENAEYLHRIDHLRKVRAVVRFISFEPLIGSVARADLKDIHWAIVGGESGPKARPMLENWVDEIELACRQHGTAFFFKQWGGKNKKAAGRRYRGATYDELPALNM
jgi:protein gp37